MTTNTDSPSQTTPTVLVTGANGLNGEELVKLFVARDIPVRALVRNKNRAKNIALPGVELVEGDFDNPESLSGALDGIERAFLLSPSTENAQTQQLAFVEAAQKSGVRHIVKLSQLDAAPDSPERFLRYHAAVEAAISASGVAFTFLRPNLFMQTLLSFKDSIKSQNSFFAPMSEGKISIVDVRDIAQVAFASLTQSGHEGKTYNITGPQSLTHADMAAALSKILGREINFVDIPPQVMRKALVNLNFPEWQADGLIEEYAAWSQDEAAQVCDDVFDATGKKPFTFAEFAHHYAGAFG